MNLIISIPDGVAFVAGKKQLTLVMRAVGNEVAQAARASIRAGGATKKRAAKRQSTAGQPPVGRTGLLASSLRVKMGFNGSRVTISDVAANKAAFYGLFLEKGAKGGVGSGKKAVKGARNIKATKTRLAVTVGSRILEPHPFLQPAVDRVAANGLAERVRQAVIAGIRLEVRKSIKLSVRGGLD